MYYHGNTSDSLQSKSTSLKILKYINKLQVSTSSNGNNYWRKRKIQNTTPEHVGVLQQANVWNPHNL